MMPEVDLSSELAEARRRLDELESLVEISPVAIVVMDADERVTGWNPAAAQLFGYSPQEAIGRLIDDLVLNEDLRGEGRHVTGEALERGRADRITRRARKDGKLVDVQMMLVPLTVDGEHVGFYAIYHDSTELQRARAHAETLLAVTQVLGRTLSLRDTFETILDSRTFSAATMQPSRNGGTRRNSTWPPAAPTMKPCSRPAWNAIARPSRLSAKPTSTIGRPEPGLEESLVCRKSSQPERPDGSGARFRSDTERAVDAVKLGWTGGLGTTRAVARTAL